MLLRLLVSFYQIFSIFFLTARDYFYRTVAVVGGTAPLCLFLENSHGKVDDAPPALGFPSFPNFRHCFHQRFSCGHGARNLDYCRLIGQFFITSSKRLCSFTQSLVIGQIQPSISRISCISFSKFRSKIGSWCAMRLRSLLIFFNRSCISPFFKFSGENTCLRPLFQRYL